MFKARKQGGSANAQFSTFTPFVGDMINSKFTWTLDEALPPPTLQPGLCHTLEITAEAYFDPTHPDEDDWDLSLLNAINNYYISSPKVWNICEPLICALEGLDPPTGEFIVSGIQRVEVKVDLTIPLAE